MERDMSKTTVKRNFADIKSVLNLSIHEHGLDIKNPFANVYLPTDQSQTKRPPLSEDQIKLVQTKCQAKNNYLAWLVALISDTGMRLSEAVGLLRSDINLDHDVPHVMVQIHPWRSLKTESGQGNMSYSINRSLSMGLYTALRAYYRWPSLSQI